jgi:cytochrome c-type biogenesis protein CcmH/NrfG
MNLFDENMAKLRLKDPEVAKLMEGQTEADGEHIEIMQTASGSHTARVRQQNGESVLLYHADDPVRDAQRQAEKIELNGDGASVLLGFGLGYLAVELAKKMEKGHLMIICEADPAVFLAAMKHVDLRPIFESSQLNLQVGREIPMAQGVTVLGNKFLTGKISVIRAKHTYKLDEPFYSQLENTIREATNYVQVNANTVLHFGQAMAHNTLENLPVIARSAGVKNLAGKFNGVPAIVVGAGPSLDKNVHLLKQLEDQALIVAVDTSLRLLLPLDIRPHLVTTIDFSRPNYEKFESIPIADDLFLVSSLSVYPDMLKVFRGPKFAMEVSSGVARRFARYMESKGTVNAGQNVGHLAFFLADYMGCDPIVLIGIDLAFPGNRSHAFNTIPSNVQFRLSKDCTCPDIFGEEVITMPAFKSGILIFNEGIKRCKARVIDATEGGARLEGTEIMRLQDVIDEIKDAPQPDTPARDFRETLYEESEKLPPADFEGMRREAKFILDEVKWLTAASKRILNLTERMNELRKAGEIGEAYTRLSQKAEKATTEFREHSAVLSLLEHYAYLTSLYMQTRSTQSIDEIEDEDEKLARQLERAERYYAEILKALQVFHKDIRQLYDRLEKDATAKALIEKAPDNPHAHLQAALIHEKIGLDGEALRLLRRAVDLDKNYVEACYRIAVLEEKHNHHDKAIEYYKLALQLQPRLKRAKEALPRAEEKHRAWLASCERVRANLEEQQRHTSESAIEKVLKKGNFYFRVGNYERARNAYDEATVAHPEISEIYYHLAHTHIATGDLEAAVACFEKALEIAPDNYVLYRDLGLIAVERNLDGAAIEFFRKAVALNPDDPDLHEILGNLYYVNKYYDKAAACYENVLKIDPNRMATINMLGRAYEQRILHPVD